MAPRGGRAEATTAELAPAPADLVIPDDMDDGLGAPVKDDFRIPTKMWNMKGKGADGRAIPMDAFYDTVDQSVVDELDAVLLVRHVSRAYTEYNNAESRNETVCKSFDCITGTMADGRKRPCAGCPDDQWYTEDGKRKKHCGEVYNIAAIDRRTGLPFWMRFKRTSLDSIRKYLHRYHLHRGKGGTNVALCMYSVRARCELSKDGKYALPVLERGPQLSQEEFDLCRTQVRFVKENLVTLLGDADAQAAAVESREPDTSFDYGNNSGGGGAGAAGAGEDFVA